MKYLKKTIQVISNIQILSALIWASTILACSYFSDKSELTSILITAAGLHVVLMTRLKEHPTTC